MEIVYKKTKSLCPQCQEVLDTDIIEKAGVMWMKKTCPRHGQFEVKIAKHAWYYKGLDSFRDSLFGKKHCKKDTPSLIRRYICSATSKCNLNCPICYGAGQREKTEDMPIDFFKEQLEKLKNRKLGFSFVGWGEPTIREDLPELIRLVRESGNFPGIYTNGVKIANDFEYLKLLKKSGLLSITLWMDTVRNPEISKKIRGEDFINLKLKAVENIKKLNISLQILAVVVKGINEGEIGDLMDFVKKENIKRLLLHSYTCYPASCFSPNEEFLIDELVESVANHSQNLFTLEDIYYSQKLILSLMAITQRIPPPCYQTALLFIPRKKGKFLHQIFRVDKFSTVLDEFEKIWQEDQNKAKKYLSLKLLKSLPRILPTLDLHCFYQAIKKIIIVKPSRLPLAILDKIYYRLIIFACYNTATFDITKACQECNSRSFNFGIKKNISYCYEIFNGK